MRRFFALLLLAVSFVSGDADAGAGPCLLGTDLPAGYRPFAPDSPWNTPVAEDAALAPDSAAMIGRLAAVAGRLTASTRKWTIPLFVIDAAACPQIALPTNSKEFHPSVDPDGDGRAETPMPQGVWPDPGQDAHMLLVDPAAGKAWDFSRVRLEAGQPASASRLYVWDLAGPGFDKPFDGPAWWTAGAVASGLPLVGGLVTLAEFKAGAVGHAILCALPTTRKSAAPGGPLELCPPASRTDGQEIGPDTIPMGARLQLDPGLDLAQFHFTPEVLALAKAMQRYGLIVGVSGDTFKIFLQNVSPDGAAWKPFGIESQLANIPTSAFRVLACPLVGKAEK